MRSESTIYGQLEDGRIVWMHTLTSRSGVQAKILTYGAILASVRAPDRHERFEDIALGYSWLDGWVKDPLYMGATVGRFANRIAHGKAQIDGQTVQLTQNAGKHHIHGGNQGFNKRLWDGVVEEHEDAASVRLTRRSPDGEEGYPGNLDVAVNYTLTDKDELKLEYEATADKTTLVNLTNHTYWNLSGSPKNHVLGQEVTIHADAYLPTDQDRIPTGEMRTVDDGPMDLRTPLALGARQQEVPGGGYDHAWLLHGREVVRPAAELFDPATARVLWVETDQPCIQCYAGLNLDGSIYGREGVPYKQHSGVCLETQNLPDAPNHDNFPSATLTPDQTYRQTTIYRFGVQRPTPKRM